MLTRHLGNLWGILRQVNIGEIHAEAEQAIDILVAGQPAGPADRLADLLRGAEVIADEQSRSMVRTAHPPLDDTAVAGAHLLVAVDLDAQSLASLRRRIPVILVNTTAVADVVAIPQVDLPTLDRKHVELVLAPLVVQQLGDRALAAARRLPVLRRAYGDWLLNETARANAVYAFSTGLAETIPVLDVPLNVADVIVLTKNQLIMVYKLALAAGRPKTPVAVIGELLGVIGAGFLWRQIARELVGLIPVVGIIPKVAVAYAGTYTIGRAVQMYLIEGEVPAGEQLKHLYTQAVERGRALAHSLAHRNERTTESPDS